jgi:hypothetical protein
MMVLMNTRDAASMGVRTTSESCALNCPMEHPKAIHETNVECCRHVGVKGCSWSHQLIFDLRTALSSTRRQAPANLASLLSCHIVLWIHNKIFPKSQTSSSASSSLEKLTRGRHPSYKGFVTPPRAQRFTALIHRELAIWYVRIPGGTFDLIV